MKKIIAIANPKGGVGKTTTAINLSAALSLAGYRTLLIDLDPQAHSTSNLGIDPLDQQLTINDVFLKKTKIQDVIIKSATEGLDLAPADFHLDRGELLLNTELFKEDQTHQAVRGLDYDFIVLDCRPTLGTLTINALNASNFVIIPCEMAPFSLEGFADLLDIIEHITTNENPNQKKIIRVLLTKFLVSDKKINAWVFKKLEQYQDIVFTTRIRKSTSLAQAQVERVTIFEYENSGRGAKDYRKLAGEFLELCRHQEENEPDIPD